MDEEEDNGSRDSLGFPENSLDSVLEEEEDALEDGESDYSDL